MSKTIGGAVRRAKESAQRAILNTALAVSGLVALGGMAGALLTWAWQVLTYLRLGAMPSFSVLDFLQAAFSAEQAPWVYWPGGSWIGAYNLLASTPAAIAYIVIPAMVYGVLASVDENMRQATEKAKAKAT